MAAESRTETHPQSAERSAEAEKLKLEQRRIKIEEDKAEAEALLRRQEFELRESQERSAQRQSTFDRRFKLLELRERREDRALKRHELELEQGRGLRFTAAQATVAGATLALLSGLIGGWIQSAATKDVAASNNSASLAIEDLKAKANIALEKQKQDAAERLDREKFETTLILKATEAASRQDQIRNLKFFLNAGFITDAEGKIAKMDEGAYPSLPPPVPDKALTGADVFNATRGSVALVTVEGNSKDTNAPMTYVGTLTLLTPSGYALIAKHLRDRFNPESMKLRANIASANSASIQLEIIKDDPDLDITLVKLAQSGSEYTGIKLAKEQALIGDEVYVLGFPAGLDLSLMIGRITSLNEQRGTIGVDAAVGPGLSGGPVLNRKGELIGILIGGRETPARGIVEPIQFLKPMFEIAGL